MRRLVRETCDRLVKIPMAGAVEVFNVSVAAGVALFEAARQRQSGPARPVGGLGDGMSARGSVRGAESGRLDCCRVGMVRATIPVLSGWRSSAR